MNNQAAATSLAVQSRMQRLLHQGFCAADIAEPLHTFDAA